jgi:acetyl-CoA carboxylase biotin carboxyl carrier protein
MDIHFIERLIELVERSSLAELEYSDGAERIHLVKNGTVVRVSSADVASSAAPLAAQLAPSRGHDAVAQLAAETGATVPPTSHFVAAGMVGTFFRASSPGDPPFVRVGDVIEEGQALALIEAMKVFNPVEADQAGTVAAILVEDGAPVEPGTLLFEIAPFVEGGA